MSSPWQSYRRTLVDAYRPRPPIQYVVSDLFSLPSLNIVYGPPGCLKSMLLADMLICVAAGNTWLEVAPWEAKNPDRPNPKPVLQSQAIWVDFDNGKNRTDNRFEALGKAYGLPTSTGIEYYSMPQPALDASKTGQVMDLIDLIHDAGASLVIIDNLATISGGKDENSSEMMAVMTNLRLVSERTGAALIVIHHSRKENGYKGKQGDSLRGFSGIRGAIDTGLLIEREPNSDVITVRAEKTRDVEIPEFAAQFTYTHKPGCRDLETARFFGVPTDKNTSDQAIEDEILDALSALQTGQTLSQLQLAKKAKANLADVGINRIKAVIGSLHLKGMIKMQVGKRGSNEYSL